MKDPQYSPHAAFDDVVAVIDSPPEKVDFNAAEEGLNLIAEYMSDDEFNTVANFIDRMRNQDIINKNLYDHTTKILNNLYRKIYGEDSIDQSD